MNLAGVAPYHITPVCIAEHQVVIVREDIRDAAARGIVARHARNQTGRDELHVGFHVFRMIVEDGEYREALTTDFMRYLEQRERSSSKVRTDNLRGAIRRKGRR